MSFSESFRNGEKAIDLTEDPEEELEKLNFLRPGKMMMADTNVVKASEGRWMMKAEGSSKRGKKLKNFQAMIITRFILAAEVSGRRKFKVYVLPLPF